MADTFVGWSTWDAFYLNGLVLLPEGLRLRFYFYDPLLKETCEQFDWRNGLHRLGSHALDKGYGQIDLKWQDAILRFEFAQGEYMRLIVKVTPLQAANHMYVLVHVDRAWDMPAETRLELPTFFIQIEDKEWCVKGDREPLLDPVSQIEDRSFAFSLEKPLWIQAWISGSAYEFSTAQAVLMSQSAAYESTRLRTDGWLEDAADGLVRSVHWNTIWEPTKGRVCSPVSRDWCRNPAWGGYVLFDWDTFFVSLLSMLEKPELGYANARAILQEVTSKGFVPNFGSGAGTSVDRSQPPVGAYCVLKLVGSQTLFDEPLSAAQLDFLNEAFPILLRWHTWWMPNRDGNRDGLLEWGSDPVPEDWPDRSIGTLRGAMYESGLDNSPMYDEVAFNPRTHTMELADVGLNALYALDAWALSKLAGWLGNEPEQAHFRGEYQSLAERINAMMWDEASGIYRNLHWDGRFSSHISPTNFYPLLAGIVPKDRARSMVQGHLLNEAEFWDRFVLPSISRNDPGYRQSERMREGLHNSTSAYWRGRIWGPMNFLVCEGLRRAGLDAECHALARKSLNLFLPEWQQESHVHENYDDLTGDGDNVASADPVYHWGALLAYLGIQELIDYEPWSGWRFGCFSNESASVENVCIGKERMRVQTGAEGLSVWREDRIIFTTSRPVIVRDFKLRADGLSCRIFMSPVASINLSFKNLPADQPIEIKVGNIPFHTKTTSAGDVNIPIHAPCRLQLNW